MLRSNMNPEEADGEDSTEEGRKEFKSGDEHKRNLPPDSKKFERDLARLQNAIRDKEANFKALPRSASQTVGSTPRDRETLLNDLRELKAKREKDIEARKQFDQELKTLNTQVSYKNDACSKLQAGLRYKTEARIDESVRRLEHQINAQQLTLKEEKRIVSEIDALKRSKKSLHDFLAMKQVVNQLRERQGFLRSQRNECMKRINASKAKEEQLNTALDKQRNLDVTKQASQASERELIKAEIDQLYCKKRELIATFNKEKNEYHAALSEDRAQAKMRRKELTAAKKAEETQGLHQRQKRSSKEQRAPRDPHEKEKMICEHLINYMESLQGAHVPGAQAAEAFGAPEVEQLPVVDAPGEGVFLRRKSANEELVGLYAGLGKITRKGSKKGRRSSGKEAPRKLTLHPLVMDQLLTLHLTPPSTVADIPKLLEELHAKKNPPPEEEPQNNGLAAAQMSPITEEVPSVPAGAAGNMNIVIESPKQDEKVSSDKTPLEAGSIDVLVTPQKLDQCESNSRAEGGDSQPSGALSSSLGSATKGAEVDEETSDASQGPLGISFVDEISGTTAQGILGDKEKGILARNYSEVVSEAGRLAKLSDGVEEVTLSQKGQLQERRSAEKDYKLKQADGVEATLKVSAEGPFENGQACDGNLSDSQAERDDDTSFNSRFSHCGKNIESDVPDRDVNAKEDSFRPSVASMKTELSEPPVNIPCAEKCLA